MLSNFRALHALAVSVAILAVTHSLSHAQHTQALPELDQGWAGPQRNAWWWASQGSRLIPLEWFKALQVAGKPERFESIEVMKGFGYLAPPGAPANSLPIGFVADTESDERFQRTRLRWKPGQGDREPWLGLTCAACHTGSLSHKGKVYLIEGAGGVSDFQGFIETLNKSLEETRNDKQRWQAFVTRVLGKHAKNKDAVEQLGDEYDRLLNWQTREAGINKTPLRYGPGRIDAFGHIYNKVALTLDPARAKRNPADAPVSIPFIWRAPQLSRVQYNGIAEKFPVGPFDVGAVGRNTGEVIGVFGDVVANPNPGLLNGFASSVRVTQLSQLEDVLAKLRPPRWPASILGEIKPDKANRGKALYEARCASCHELVDRTDLKKIITVQMSFLNRTGTHRVTKKDLPVAGTDPWMACNASDYKSSAGIVGGLRHRLLTQGSTLSPTEEVPLGLLLRVTVGAVLMDKKGDLAQEALRKFIGVEKLPSVDSTVQMEAPFIPDNPDRPLEKERQLARCKGNKEDDNFGYTSRPLNGIWATAPYLHNGSVPNMYELLLPPSERSQSFWVGTREYDAENMGFRTARAPAAPGNSFEFLVQNAPGRPIDGNSNLGHDYDNASLTKEQRYDLIEYLKRL